MPEENDSKVVDQALQLTIAWLGNPNSRIEPEDLPRFVSAMHDTIVGLGSGAGEHAAASPNETFEGAVSLEESLASKDHIISMIDGKPYKMLRRHLTTQGLTPEEYIRRYKLPSDYPMVAKSYSAKRRKLAKKIGLGQKGRAARALAKPATTTSAAKPAAKSAAKSEKKPATKPAPSGRRPRKPKGA